MESPENSSNLNLETKSKEEYLSQISGNIEEKSFFLMQELQAKKLPEIDGRTRILDCGIGGGELIKYLKEEHKDPFVDVFALDIVHEYIKRATSKDQSTVFGVVGDVFQPPFKEESFSAVNLSAILHEIISYGSHSETINRFAIIQKLFSGLSKCLIEGGVFSYRDVYLPDNHNEEKLAVYSGHFSSFVSIYGNQILQNTKKVFEIDLPKISIQKDFCKISGCIHYHRELQRHFITFTDFLCAYTKGASLKDTLVKIDDKDSIESLFNNGFSRQHLLDDWSKREGFETYTYASVCEIQKILANISQENNLELKVEQVLFPERIGYSNFIGQYTDFVIPDKKQMMLIRKK